MNKIFKVIWSKRYNQLVVTSELAKGQAKSSSSVSSGEIDSRIPVGGKFTVSTLSSLLVTVIGMFAGMQNNVVAQVQACKDPHRELK